MVLAPGEVPVCRGGDSQQAGFRCLHQTRAARELLWAAGSIARGWAGGGCGSPVWLSCSVLLLHWDSPTMATILAPRLERLFLLAVMVTESALPRALFSMLYISPLMLELRTTFLAAEELASPLNMVSHSRARRPWLCWVGSAAGEARRWVKASNTGQWHWPRHCAPTQSSPAGMGGPSLQSHEIQAAQPIGITFPTRGRGSNPWWDAAGLPVKPWQQTVEGPRGSWGAGDQHLCQWQRLQRSCQPFPMNI